MNGFELCGWIGAVLVLIAYYMVSTGKAKGDSIPFQLINVGGAILLVAYTYNCQAYASMSVNIIWIGIGLSSFIKFINISGLKLERKFVMSTKTKLITTIFTTLFLLTSQVAYTQTMDPTEPNSIDIENIEEDTSEDLATPSAEEIEEMKKLEKQEEEMMLEESKKTVEPIE
jgi:hypothetical protein